MLFPGLLFAFSVLGGSLGISTAGLGYQRDVRVLDNSADPSAHANVTPNASFPGAVGARLSVWKGAHAWASDNALAARNFDYDWQGAATSNPAEGNVVGWDTNGCSGGTLAYTETPISDGWRIVMCDNWTWSDSASAPGGGQFDIQGIVTHELGHALGLGHSSVNCGSCGNSASMCAFICSNGVAERTIEADDQAGLQSIYGTIPSNKPLITALAGSFTTGTLLTITGQNFAPTVNVKFTANGGNDLAPIPGTVTNVASTGGGTQIVVPIPYTAFSGNVLVWEPAAGLLSNAFPIDVTFVPQPPPVIATVAPATVSAFLPGTITLTGSGFVGTTQVLVGGIAVSGPLAFSIVNDTTLTFAAPPAPALGPISVTLASTHGASNAVSLTYVQTSPPAITAQSVAFGNVTFSASFGGGANDSWILVAATSAVTVPFLGFTVLQAPVPIASGQFGPTGLASQSVVMPTGLAGLVFHLQLGTIDDVSGTFAASNLTTTTVLL